MEDAPSQYELLFNEEQVEAAIDQVATQLSEEISDQFPVIVCVMKGGLVFTADLMKRFSFDLELDYVHLSRYHGTRGAQCIFQRRIDGSLRDRTVVLVDEVYDEGLTLKAIVEDMQHRSGRLITAALVRKHVPGNKDPIPDVVGLHAPNRFLIGRGMDLDGRFRNLNQIYVMRDDD